MLFPCYFYADRVAHYVAAKVPPNFKPARFKQEGENLAEKQKQETSKILLFFFLDF